MKYFVLLFLLIGCGKNAVAVNGDVKCTFSPAYGECVLTNNTNHNLTCRFDSDARTLHGFPMFVRRTVFLYPRMSEWNYARAFNPWFDPIVSMTSSFDCRESK